MPSRSAIRLSVVKLFLEARAVSQTVLNHPDLRFPNSVALTAPAGAAHFTAFSTTRSMFRS
jgi:hypothetical protein